MVDFLKKTLIKFGVDGAIFYTSITRIIQGFGGVITVLFIIRFLSDAEQGFYYTFASILAIQIFFELGLNGIITQYVAHEVSHLTQNGDTYEGDEKYISRMASLLHFCVKWYSRLVFFLLIVLITIGLIFFNFYYKSSIVITWQLPWVLICLGTVLNFFISPIAAFLEGLGKVKDIAKIRFAQQLLTILVMWVGLLSGMKLYVGGLGSLIGGLVLTYFIVRKFYPLLQNIYRSHINERISYKSEIFPFQWKIALSWMSGYFIFQLFNPVLFATEGPVIAGQMGMTMTVLNAILALTLSWISTKIPLFSGLIAKKEYKKLDAVFNRTLLQSSTINFASLLFFFIGLYIVRHYNLKFGDKVLGNRFISYLPILCMMGTILLNHIVASWATYLRCHKKEPMLIQSIVMGILCSLSTILLGKYFGLYGITIGYIVLCIIGFFWSFLIFIENKKKWHYE